MLRIHPLNGREANSMQPSDEHRESQPNLPFSDDPVRKAWEDVVIHRREPVYPVRKVVLESWVRCRDLGLDPFGQHPPAVVSKNRLSELQSRYREFIEIAQPVLEMVEISVRGTGFIVTLAEKDGHVLEVRGDQDVLEMAVKNFYVPGCQRSTEHAGTNGIGLCLEVGTPIQITGAEHFNVNHHPWTCSSAPIRSRRGELIGAVTLSGRVSGMHRHTLALVNAAASSIESRLLERDLTEGAQRLNSMLTSIYNSVSEGFIALDKNHRVTHLNQTASKMLGLAAGSLVGKPITDFVISGEEVGKHLDSLDFSEPIEIGFVSTDGPRTFLCRIDPVQTPNQKMLGMIITMAEKRRMIDIAKRIGGNYSKYEFGDIRGQNPHFLKQIEMAKIAAKSNSRVLIIGESGTGKELFAQAIHSHSHRCSGPFVAISCAAIPRDLIESELFGYKGGAFTGAREKGMIGKFELAHKGTLFLDEINGLPLDLQAKLLRVLQQNEIMRLGDTRTIPVDVRIIAASNTDLVNAVEAGHFREDLYYRLNVMEILIPSAC
jgi:sigma-54 dependent transcriptional regulator, acetoin dehydrogenase operon transcriptional activator AcoR